MDELVDFVPNKNAMVRKECSYAPFNEPPNTLRTTVGFSVPRDGTLENEEDGRLLVGNIQHVALGSSHDQT